MKLIYEIDKSQQDYEIFEEINEQTGSKVKKYRIKGIFSTIGEKNRNGRIYPREIWENCVKDYQNTITSGSLNRLCEWQHPARTSVDPMEAVAAIDRLFIDGKYVMGEATLLDNPKANQLKSLIDNGIKISVSSRGVGKIEEGVVKEFKLLTYDLVDTPSDHSATMNGLVESYTLSEGVLQGKEFMINESGEVQEAIPKVPEITDLYTDDEIRTALSEKIKNMFNNISEVSDKGDTQYIKNLKQYVTKNDINKYGIKIKTTNSSIEFMFDDQADADDYFDDFYEFVKKQDYEVKPTIRKNKITVDLYK